MVSSLSCGEDGKHISLKMLVRAYIVVLSSLHAAAFTRVYIYEGNIYGS